MSDKKYLNVNLQRDSRGQLFVKGSLDALDYQEEFEKGMSDINSQIDRLNYSSLLNNAMQGMSANNRRGYISEELKEARRNRDPEYEEDNYWSASELVNTGVAVMANATENNKIYVTKKMFDDAGWEIDDAGVASFNRALSKYGIDTPEKISHFLAQCSVESKNGEWVRELGSEEYIVDNYAYHPDLGNRGREDALKYRGSGYIQLTGRYNYEKFAEAMGDSRILSEGYTYVAEKYAAEAAAYWWSTNNMNRLVDNLQKLNRSTENQVVLVSARVNGFDPDGTIPITAHIDRRIESYKKWRELLF